MGEQEVRYSKEAFVKGLFAWSRENPRQLPWKDEQDPYLIWLSEIILQQTRVAQGKAYFLRFKERFPTVFDLAKASEQEVMKLWEGLGYYSRARNLHATARYIANELSGKFPRTYEELLSLKGVGPYTAAAIASFAYDLPRAVVDGNVFRVLSRFFGLDIPIDSTQGKKQFTKIANLLIDESRPGAYNQAIMDFGATACTPRSPSCGSCPMRENCFARQNDRIEELPVKAKKPDRRMRFFHYQVFCHKDQLLIRKRTRKDIWHNLFDFPLLETEELMDGKEPDWREALEVPEEIGNVRLIRKTSPFRQTLSHQIIVAVFWEWETEKPLHVNQASLYTVSRHSLKNYPFPKIVDWYLKDNSLNLELF